MPGYYIAMVGRATTGAQRAVPPRYGLKQLPTTNKPQPVAEISKDSAAGSIQGAFTEQFNLVDRVKSSYPSARTLFKPSKTTSLVRTQPKPDPLDDTRGPPGDNSFSLLLSLPRRLRDRIYKYALEAPDPFCWPYPPPRQNQLGLGLLRGARKVYEEAAPVLYLWNKFAFRHPSDASIFRIVASPTYSFSLRHVVLHMDPARLQLWINYFSSKNPQWSFKRDLPNCRNLLLLLESNDLVFGIKSLPSFPNCHLSRAVAMQAAAVHVYALMMIVIRRILDQKKKWPRIKPAPDPYLSDLQYPRQPHRHQGPLPAYLLDAREQPDDFVCAFSAWKQKLGLYRLWDVLEEISWDTRRLVRLVSVLKFPRSEFNRFVRMYPDEITINHLGNAYIKCRPWNGVEEGIEITPVDYPPLVAAA
ncbi:hypothetical protein M011DRAFT_465948 [Sporormia fimetaria CBS 119925]|uniref:Uncharacterized protein n=1 Tax=Sporormia fimetaria CBS 119925 TaxID=1340428 RepID=A0A6A6VFX8_9PLEO|nr:hypothetical protein M011DRAFT_465948 [Sporormia fimetaria CBS 119925]